MASSLFVPLLLATWSLASGAARAQEDDDGREVETRETALPGIAEGLRLRVVTSFAMGDDYEIEATLFWRD